jgi:hypothetical protein
MPQGSGRSDSASGRQNPDGVYEYAIGYIQRADENHRRDMCQSGTGRNEEPYYIGELGSEPLLRTRPNCRSQ